MSELKPYRNTAKFFKKTIDIQYKKIYNTSGTTGGSDVHSPFGCIFYILGIFRLKNREGVLR